jgi:hypothetical protein
VRALALLATLIAACGRIGFDQVAGGGGDGGVSDARGSGDGDGAITPDAPPDAATACAFAIPLTQNVRAPASTCTGRDLLTVCQPAGVQEVVFAFTAPATASYNYQAYDPGTMNISNSTAQVNAACNGKVGGCTGISNIMMSAGQTAYFAVEASNGTCANIEFLIQ